MDNARLLRIYHLEQYLFEDVRKRYHSQRFLNAFDFFCIIIWKSNRSKSTIAKRLLKEFGKEAKAHQGSNNLEAVCRMITHELFECKSHQKKLQLITEKYGFRLPMASAILTVLYPEVFTIYDTRVCEELKHRDHGDFRRLSDNLTWEGYVKFVKAVNHCVTSDMSLRDKDRVLWAGSFEIQLKKDIASAFEH